MIQNERDCRHEHVLDVARQMLTAARTAPKGKGIDVIEAALVTGEDIKKLSEKMVAMVEEHGMKFFLRDADFPCSALKAGRSNQPPKVGLMMIMSAGCM